MAKKAKTDRSDPNTNKSLAIRMVLEKAPAAKAAEIAAAVHEQFGHKVTPTLIYLVKSKVNVKANKRARKAKGQAVGESVGAATDWIQGIKLARQLLKATGSVENATAILKAVES